jgi:Matrixin
MSRLLDTVTFGAARRRRRMARLLDQLDSVPIDTLPVGLPGRSSFRPPRRPPHRPPDRRRLPGLRAIATLTVWVLIIGAVVYLARLGNHGSHLASPVAAPSALGFGQDASHASPRLVSGSDSYPTPGIGEQKTRILPAPAAPAGTGDYNFLEMNKKSPVAYDPCRPIHYVIRDRDTPTGGDQLVRQAVAAVSKATGLQFIDDGMTTEAPSAKRAWYQPTRYGDKWAPVLLAWTDPKETPELVGAVTGLGGSQSFWYGGPLNKGNSVYLTGAVSLDAPQMTEIEARPDGKGIDLAVVEHELGHLVGLAHVNDPTQIMNPETGSAKTYAAGDLRGLAQLGRGSCHPEL